MNTERASIGPWRDAMALFDAWLDADASERAELLAQAQADTVQHQKLLALIAADASAEMQQFMPEVKPPAVQAHAGQRLGPWKLLGPIGSGGMGEVWLAERSDGLYDAHAAIKLLHARATTPAQRARFAREGELLARLGHPHIARLLDAGVQPDGARYLVLEYVAGAQIDDWCDVRRVGLAQRLALFLQVCEAVAYAHAHLVVHRDLKPANLLVSEDGQVKLLDFGVAKLLADDTSSDSDLTRAAAAGLTPAYAAPEQLTGGAISTATDVYALGVLLFQLLSGQRPYAGTDSTPAQWVRDIVEAEPLSLSRAQPSVQAAAARGTSAAQLARALRSDLAFITARALRKQPGARYPSVQALAEDVQRYLRHEPVSARAGDWRYRAARFVRRNRLAVAGSVLLASALAAGVGATLWQADRARRQAVLAQTEAAKATAIKDFLLKSFNTAQIGQRTQANGAATTVLQLIESGGAELLKDDLKIDPEARLELLTALGELQRINGLHAQAEPLQLKALELAKQHFGATSEKYVYALVERATNLPKLGRRAESNQLYDDAIALMERIGQQHTESYPFALWMRGVNAYRTDQYELALSLFERAELACRQHRPHDATHAFALQWQANVHSMRDQFDAAQAALTKALALTPSAEHPEQAEALLQLYLGDLQTRRGEMEQALAAYDRALSLMQRTDSGRNPDRVVVLVNAARARHELGQPEAARAELREALALAQHHPTGEPGRTLSDRVLSAQVALDLADGNAAAALVAARQLAARWPADATGSSYAANRMLLAEAERQAGQPALARQAAERAAAIYEAAGSDTLLARQARLVLAEVLARQGDAAASEQFRRVLETARADSATPPRSRQLQKARALAGLARLSLSTRPQEAARLAREGSALLPAPVTLRERQVLSQLQETEAKGVKQGSAVPGA